MPIHVEKVSYGNFGNCIRIHNDVAELYVTTDFGPRVIHYSLLGAANILFTNDCNVNIKKGEDFDNVFYPGAYWNIYGGNRLWVSPEVMPDTFYPDHDPVEYERISGGAIFTCKPQLHNNVQLSVQVTLDESSSRAFLNYSVKNIDCKPKIMAAWSVTAVDAGGIEIIPQATTKKGVLPNRLVSLWDYSDMTDERIFWGKNYIVITQNPDIAKPTKVGINNVDGWACYLNKGTCFVIRYQHDPKGNYHDFGASYESFANESYLEMESVGALTKANVGQSVTHQEVWEAFLVDSPPNCKCEKEINYFVDKFIKRAN